MNKLYVFISLLVLLASLITFSGCDYVTGAALAPYVVSTVTPTLVSDVTPQQAYEFLMISSVQTHVIDVRAPTEYAAGHLPSAININFNASDFKEQISLLDRNARYAVYCLGGVRSAMARKVMQELGFKYVFNMTGGYGAWLAAGLPTDK